MASMKAKLEVLSKRNMTEMRQNNDFFEGECTRFLKNSSKNVLLIETNCVFGNTLRVKQYLEKLQGDLRPYGEEKNQMFLEWTQLKSVVDPVKVLPKFPNLVGFKFDRSTADEQDVKIFEKLVERLSMGVSKKMIVMSKKDQGLKSILENIDSKVLCTLDEENEVIDMEENSKHTFKSIPKTKNLFEAASKGNIADVEFFIESGVSVNQIRGFDGNTALHMAAQEGHKDVVLKLLQHKAKHLQNSRKDTPLHFAVKNGHNETAIVFLEHGIDVNVKGDDWKTPLHYASEKGFHDIVQILLEYDADIQAKRAYCDSTPLHLAASNGHDMVVKTLLDYEADVDFEGHYENTPLHNAVQNNHLKVVKLLEQEKANLKCRNHYGQTPLDIAKNEGHSAIEEYLISKGGDKYCFLE